MADAMKSDWRVLPLPEKHTIIFLDRVFTAQEMDHVVQGFLPEEMEDKWFICWEGDQLFFYRSWTGFCIYVVRFVQLGDAHRMIEAKVNRDPGQYRETSDTRDIKMISSLIDVLLLKQPAEF
jgi:hypothetical protein